MPRKSSAPAEPKPGEPVPNLLPDRPTLKTVAEVAAGCKACDLYKRGTQTVFGEGPRAASLMFVGEQPGDAEDLAGHPFVGPAGKLLDRALEEAGIDRGSVYVTNVVKHFKWEPRGKRRIHAKPNAAEVAACRPWLETEIAPVKPHVPLCLGARGRPRSSGSRSRCRGSAGRSSSPRSRLSSPRPCIRPRFFVRRTRRRGARRWPGSLRI